MGQPITISGTTFDGPVAAFHTDRAITGQDGIAFDSVEAAEAADSLPGDLASRLYASDEAIDHVFIASNQVVVRRDGGWDEAAVRTASAIVTDFFVFYADA